MTVRIAERSEPPRGSVNAIVALDWLVAMTGDHEKEMLLSLFLTAGCEYELRHDRVTPEGSSEAHGSACELLGDGGVADCRYAASAALGRDGEPKDAELLICVRLGRPSRGRPAAPSSS